MKNAKVLLIAWLVFATSLIGLLIFLAMPSRTCGPVRIGSDEIQLKYIYSLQKSYHQVNLHYADSLYKTGYELPEFPLERKFDFHVLKADDTSFVVISILLNDFDGDGELRMATVNQTGEVKVLQED